MINYQFLKSEYPVIDNNLQFFNSKGFYTKTNFTKKFEFTKLAQGMILISLIINQLF